jgi:hypothetical protein
MIIMIQQDLVSTLGYVRCLVSFFRTQAEKQAEEIIANAKKNRSLADHSISVWFLIWVWINTY